MKNASLIKRIANGSVSIEDIELDISLYIEKVDGFHGSHGEILTEYEINEKSANRTLIIIPDNGR